MENSINEIDDIIRGKLINYEEETSSRFWPRLRGRLYKRRMTSIIIVILAILSGLVFWMMMPEKAVEDIVSINQLNNEKITETPDMLKIDENEINEQIAIEDKEINTTDSYTNSNEVSKKQVEPSNIIVDKEPQKKEIEIIEINKNSGDIKRDYYKLNQIRLLSANLLSPNESKQLISNNDIEDIKYNDLQSSFNTYNRFSISLEIGYDVSWKDLSADPQFEDFKNYRIENEKPATNLSYGIRFNYQYKNWIISTGIDHTSVSEKLYYNINKTIIDTDGGYYDVDTIWVLLYDPDDNLVPMIIGYDRTWIEEYKDINYSVSSTNKYNYIEIPISVGYRFALGKFSISPSVGASFAFLYSASGKLPMPNSNNFVELDSKSSYLQRSITNISFSLGFEYSITPNYGVYIKPMYKQGLNSIYTNYPLSGYYRNAGVKFGINIYLQ